MEAKDRIAAVVRASLEARGEKPLKNPLANVTKLFKVLQEKHAGEDFDECGDCGNSSPVSLSSCPYCDARFEAVDDALGGPREEAPKAKEKSKPAPEPSQKVINLADEIKKAKSKKAGASVAEKVVDNRKLSKDERKQLKSKIAERVAEVADATVDAVIDDQYAKDAKKSAAVVKASELVDCEIVKSQEKELYDAMSRIKELQVEAASSWWEIGQHMSVIYRNDLWKQMRDSEGAPLYRGWKQFVENEIGIQDHLARTWMSAARFSKEQAVSLGVAKISLIDTVAESGRPQLVNAAKDLSLKELRKEVKAARVEHGAYTNGKRKLAMNEEENLKKRDEEKAKRKREAIETEIDPSIVTVVLPASDSGDFEEADEANPDAIEICILGNNGAVIHVTVDVASRTWSTLVERSE